MLIFCGGMAWDAILSVDTIFTANFSALGAAFTTMSVTILGYLMFDKIVEEVEEGNRTRRRVNWRKVWTLAFGSATGAGVTTEALKHLFR